MAPGPRQDGVSGGINNVWKSTKTSFICKIWQNLGQRPKNGLHLKNYAIFQEFWSSPKMSKIRQNLRWRPKTKVFISKYTQILMNSLVQPHKQTIFIAKSTKKQFLLTNSGLINSILGVSGLELHSSRTEPVNFFEAQSSLREAQFSFWDAQAVIWREGTALEFPFVAPGLGGAKPFKSGWAVFLIPMQKYHHNEQQSFIISLWPWHA